MHRNQTKYLLIARVMKMFSMENMLNIPMGFCPWECYKFERKTAWEELWTQINQTHGRFGIK